MVEGIIFEGDREAGTFTVCFDPDVTGHETVKLHFPEGLRIGRFIELATEAGNPLTLMAIPKDDRDD